MKTEAQKEANRRYYQRNREKILGKHKEWRKKNKGYQSEYYNDMKDGYNYVYLLEDYNYVGCTNNLYRRFAKHSYLHKRDCTNYKILFKSKDREEALQIEEKYHNMGYEGKNFIYK